jgi:geranylgeranylglycerol-phosphate geranylgeranyltransferase
LNYLHKAKAVIAISRPINILITFCSIVVACFIATGQEVINMKIILAAISGAMSISAGNVINDYFDIEIDKINRPNRVLPKKLLSINEALVIYIVLAIISLVISLYFSLDTFLFMAGLTILIFLYSYLLKRIPLLGNLVVALVLGLVGFIYSGIIYRNIKAVIIPAVFAFLINLIREMIKVIEDVKGDSSQGNITLALKYGIQNTKYVIAFFTVCLIIFSFIPFFFEIFKIEFFLIVMMFVNPMLIYFLRELFRNDSSINLNKLSLLLKICMVIGLIAILLGK